MILECFEYNQHFVAMMNIINHARLTNIEGKFQKHHIIPRCFYRKKGLEIDNSETNLVNLTREEHQKVHQLAALCAKEIVHNELIWANYLMHGQRDYSLNSTDEFRKKISEASKGRTHSEEARKKMSEAKKGKALSEETRRKVSESLKGHTGYWTGKKRGPMSDETRKKMTESKQNISEETRKKISESLKTYWSKRKATESSPNL